MKPASRSQLQDALATALGRGAPSGSVSEPAAFSRHERRGHVLVVDDVPVNRAVARAMLTPFGYTVEEASNGQDALGALERQRFDVILMDCEMPVLDGYEAAAEIRRRENAGESVPIIALTASAMASDVERALAAGMDGHVTKPFALEELHAALDTALAASHTSAEATSESNEAETAAGLQASQAAFLIDSEGRPRREIIETFLRELPRRVELLLTAAGDADLEGISEAAHGLRGSSGFLGAPRLATLMADIEARARDGEVPDAKALAAVKDVSREVEAALAGLLD